VLRHLNSGFPTTPPAHEPSSSRLARKQTHDRIRSTTTHLTRNRTAAQSSGCTASSHRTLSYRSLCHAAHETLIMTGEAWLYLLAVLINAVNLFLQVFFTIMYSDLEW